MREVLGRMRRAGRLDAELERVAAAADLDLVPPARPFGAPHLVVDLAGKLETLGLGRAIEVRTTLDPALQRDVERSVRSELAADPRLGQAAVLVLDNLSGEVLAYVGSADFLDAAREGQNDGVRARRQPGSALEALRLRAGAGERVDSASVLSDVDLEVATAGGAWLPRNYDRRQHGPAAPGRAGQQLQRSRGRADRDPRARAVLDVLRQAGFASLEASAEHYGAGLVLGNGDVSLWSSPAPTGGSCGRAAPPSARGDRLPWRASRGQAGARPAALPPSGGGGAPDGSPLRRGARAPAFGLDNALRLPFPVAAKTGTSRAYVDNWTVGFTHERTVAVWVGNFDGRPMQRVGHHRCRAALRPGDAPGHGGHRPTPLVDRARFEHVRICSPSAPGRRGVSRVVRGGLPARERARRALCDAPAGRRAPGARARCAVRGWAERERLEVAPAAGSADAPGFLTPRDGDEFLLEASIPASSQSIPVRVRGQAELRVDGDVVPLDALGRTRVVLAAGVHRLELRPRQGSGSSRAVQIRVRGGDARPALPR